MQGTKSTVTYFDDYIIKHVQYDELNQPLNIAVAREFYFATLAKTTYPYIPDVYSLNDTKITMQKINGTRFDDYILNHSTTDTFIRLSDKVSHAVQSILTSGISHGDVCFANLIVDDAENIWVIDFGMSTLLFQHSNISDEHLHLMGVEKDTLNDFLLAENLQSIIPLDYPLMITALKHYIHPNLKSGYNSTYGINLSFSHSYNI